LGIHAGRCTVNSAQTFLAKLEINTRSRKKLILRLKINTSFCVCVINNIFFFSLFAALPSWVIQTPLDKSKQPRSIIETMLRTEEKDV
jgi:hypothetical protein